MSARGWLFVALLTSVWACGDDAVPPADAALDTGADTRDAAPMLVVPEAPMPPAPADAGTCPDGWSTIDVAGATACQPWDEAGPGCSGTDVRFPGDPLCAPLGAACPSGPFPADVTEPALYVDDGAVPGGDGTIGAPFETIDEGVAAATSGVTIVLAAGTYTEEVTLPEGVSIRGACVAETIVEGAEGPLNSATIVLGEGSLVRDLTVRGQRPGLRAASVSGRAENVRVEATEVGIAIVMGGELVADGIAVVGTSGDLGSGLFMLSGSRATLERAWFDDNRTFGVAAGDAGTELMLRRTVVQGTRVNSDDMLGIGIVANGGASLTIEESVASRNVTSGVSIQGGGDVAVDMSVIRDSVSQPSDGLLGVGIIVQGRAAATIERSLLHRNQGSAISLQGLGTHMEASDLVLLETLGHDGGSQGSISIVVSEGSTADIERVFVEGAYGLGVSVTGPDSHLVARDLVVRAIEPRSSDLAAGRGIDIERRASAELSRVLLEEVYGSAILVADIGSEATLSDVLARELRSDARTRASGRGLTLQFGGCVDVARFEIVEALDVGILAYGEGVELRAVDLSIEDTLPRECAVDTCMDQRSGTGITASDTAVVELERFSVAGSALAGLQIARGARITARDGVVARNAVGVNAQDPSFDPSDVSMGVQFVDNGINLDASALPIPEPAER